MGQCGLSLEQAWNTGYHEYELRLRGYEQSSHQAWEIARWQIWHQYQLSPNIKSGRKPRRPVDLQRFPWEESEKDELKRKAKKYGKVSKKELNELLKIFRTVGMIKDDNNNGQDR